MALAAQLNRFDLSCREPCGSSHDPGGAAASVKQTHEKSMQLMPNVR